MITVTLFGGFRLDVDGREVRLADGPQRLVATLALRGRMGRSRLAGALWPEVEEHRALARLRTAVWRVNQVAPGLVSAAGGQIALQDRTRVDVHRLVELSGALMRGDEVAYAGWTTPELVGDLLPDWDDEWLVDERERLRQMRVHSLQIAAEQLARGGRYGLAVDVALTVLQNDPVRESAYRTLILVHLAEGNVAEARRAYRRCEDILERELGVAPNRATTALLTARQESGGPGTDRT